MTDQYERAHQYVPAVLDHVRQSEYSCCLLRSLAQAEIALDQAGVSRRSLWLTSRP
jgi:hypothetical protein